MQFRLLPAVCVFLGSYLPLSLILLAQDFDYSAISRGFCFLSRQTQACEIPLRNPAYSISIFFVCAISFVLTIGALVAIRPSAPVIVTEARHTPADLINYTLPYVVSFMSIDYRETGKFIGLTIFLGWMFWITYRSGQLILNPLLIAVGWSPYELTYRFVGDEKTRTGVALSQTILEAGSTHLHAQVQSILIIKQAGNEK